MSIFKANVLFLLRVVNLFHLDNREPGAYGAVVERVLALGTLCGDDRPPSLQPGWGFFVARRDQLKKPSFDTVQVYMQSTPKLPRIEPLRTLRYELEVSAQTPGSAS